MNDWINAPNAFDEIGCIHTTQGYDLNYAAVIFGEEINYNRQTDKIEIDPKKYLDIYGKKGISDPDLLKQYIIIYKTIMYRGIKGTYVYACNKELREYLKEHIETYTKEIPFRILPIEEVKPYVNCIPLINLSAAAGKFSDLQQHDEVTWIELPIHIGVKKDYFVCKVIGESMNKIIPNGSYCLFKRDEGGSRNGKIVLIESTSFINSESGSGYTVKEYHSKKNVTSEGWNHQSIILRSLSDRNDYPEIELLNDELSTYKVVGIFMTVL